MKRAWVILAAGVLLACAAAAKDPQAHASGDDDNPGRGVNIYSLQREVELGRQMATEVERQAMAVSCERPAGRASLTHLVPASVVWRVTSP